MDNIQEKLLELALYEYYSALAANLPPLGIAAMQKNGKFISAGPVLYTNGHIETAIENLGIKLAIDYYNSTNREHEFLPFEFFDATKAMSAWLSVRPDPKNSDEYITSFHMEP